MTDQPIESMIEMPSSAQPAANPKRAQMIGIAIGGLVLAVSGFFVGYAVHGNSASSTPSGGFPGGGQFPGGANGQLPGGGQFPGGANGQQPGGGQFPGGANGQQPGGGQFPGGANGQLPGGGQFPGGANGQQPSAPPTGGPGSAVTP